MREAEEPFCIVMEDLVDISWRRIQSLDIGKGLFMGFIILPHPIKEVHKHDIVLSHNFGNLDCSRVLGSL
jgi:hypothetical protein